MLSDDEDDPELKELEALEKKAKHYGWESENAEYKQRKKAIMKKYTAIAKAGAGGGAKAPAAPTDKAARVKFEWGKDGGGDLYEKATKMKAFNDAKDKLSAIHDGEWQRDASAPGNAAWRRFTCKVGKVGVKYARMTLKPEGILIQEGRVKVDVDEDDEAPAKKDGEGSSEPFVPPDEAPVDPEGAATSKGRGKREKKSTAPASDEPAAGKGPQGKAGKRVRS